MKFLRRLLPFLLLVVLLAAAALIWLKREYIQDYLTLRSYDPPQAIAQLAVDTTMSDYGKRLFYVNKPQLDDKVAFNEHCKNIADEAAVLGCFKGDRLGIYIYDVTDPRLNGIEQVTSAHEMLHQAYERLSDDERKRIDGLLESYYRNDLTDQSVKDKMAIYEQTEPHALVNEMHSIFGTEIRDLPEELETYYSRYFNDRQSVVEYRETSQAEFDKYRQQIEEFDQRLGTLKTQIDALESELTSDLVELKQAKAALDADLAASRIQEYNAGVVPYNDMVKSYNQRLAMLNERIKEYNQLVKERNAVSVQVSELNEALDSSLTPQ